MTPIISPLWFYLFDITEKLGATSTIVAVILGIGIVVYIICEGNDIKLNKTLITIFIISTILSIFTPTKEACYQMAAASLVTPDNISIVDETAKNAIDYIVESVDKALDEEGDK